MVVMEIYEDIMEIEVVPPEELMSKLTMAGRKTELGRLKEFAVFRRIPRQDMPQGYKAIPVLWFDKMKNGEVRSRLCVRDVKKNTTVEYFAATPTMAALRLILALACALNLEIQTADLVTAFMHAPLEPNEQESCSRVPRTRKE